MTKYTTHRLGEIKTIALATDGTKYGSGAEQEAIFLCRTWKARLVILHVITIDTELATSVHAESSTLRREVQNYIERLQKEAAKNGIACQAIIEESYLPEKTIIELARKYHADMIVMGRHDRSGLMKLLGGSVASKIIGLGFPKVLVVPRDAGINVERILLATDGSEFGEQATEEVLSLGEHCTALQQIYTLSAAARESDLGQAEERVVRACQRLKERKIDVECIPIAQVGAPSVLITRTARKNNVGMIIMGGHGRGLSKLLMGHVTEKVISLAHCAVLVIEK